LRGKARRVLIHTEVQARRQEIFGFRMWQYMCSCAYGVVCRQSPWRCCSIPRVVV
jgi:hypothetical protein